MRSLTCLTSTCYFDSMKGCFKGDADELVEALTEACKKPSTTAPLQV